MEAVAKELLREQRPVPVSCLCRVLEIPRSSAYYPPKQQEKRPLLDQALVWRAL